MINLLFGLGSICFALALLPAVIKHQPPPRLTCLMTAFWLWVYEGCYLALGYEFSFIAGGVTAILWTILSVQVAKSEA